MPIGRIIGAPAPPRLLFGRDAALNDLRCRLIDGTTVALCGLPGVGKTALATALAYDERLLTHFEGGVFWASLGPHADLESVLKGWAQALGVDVGGASDATAKAAQIAARLQSEVHGRPVLLIVDDVWRWDDARPFLRIAFPGCSHLCTTRDAAVARRFAGDATPLPELSPAQAAVFLAQCCPQARTAAPDDLRALAQTAGGLPLGLTLIAVALNDHSGQVRWVLSEIRRLGDLDAQLSLEVHDRPAGPDGAPPTVRAVVEMSVEALQPAGLRHAFAMLGAFAAKPMHFTREAALAVWDAGEEEGDMWLHQLVERGLLEIAGEGRFMLHQILTALANTRLGDDVTARERHAEFYDRLLRTCGGYEWNMANYPSLVPDEFEVFRAIDYCLERWEQGCSTAADMAICMVSQVSWYLHWRGYYGRRARLCDLVLERAGTPGFTEKYARHANRLGNLCVDRGWTATHTGDLGRARNLADRARALLRQDERIFAEELGAQIDLLSGAADAARERFSGLRARVADGSRFWCIFSFRLADALHALRRFDEHDELIVQILQVVKHPQRPEQVIADIHARVLYRWAIRGPGRHSESDALGALEVAARLFEGAGTVTGDRALVYHELARRTVDETRSRQLLEAALLTAQTLELTELIRILEPELDTANRANGEREPDAPPRPGPIACTRPTRSAPREPTMTTPSLPRPLFRAHQDGKLALFIGSGLSLGVSGDFPTWTELPQRLLDRCVYYGALDDQTIALKRKQFSLRMRLESMLSELGSLQTALGRDFQAAVNDIFRPADAAPGPVHQALRLLNVRAILTTNYDQLIEALGEVPPRQPYCWTEAAAALGDLKVGRKVLLKVHGSAERHDTVVMSELKYAQVRGDISYQSVIRFLLQEHTFLFVGYGMNDPFDLDLALRVNADAFKSATQRHYALVRKPTDTDRDRLERDYNVIVVPYEEHAEVPAVLSAIAAARP